MVAALVILAGPAYFGWIVWRERHFNVEYMRMAQGTSEAEVRRRMGFEGRSVRLDKIGHLKLDWNYTPLSPDQVTRIKYAVRWRGVDFFVPIIYEFQFDGEGRLVGKHLYD